MIMTRIAIDDFYIRLIVINWKKMYILFNNKLFNAFLNMFDPKHEMCIHVHDMPNTHYKIRAQK